MKSFLRLFSHDRSQRHLNPRKTPKSVRPRRWGLEELEGRLLMNVHPAGETPHHIHPHLSIFIDGQNFVIPASIGSSSPGPQIGPTNENAHTHTADGIIHYNEETAAFRDLKEFFDTWGGIFTQNELKVPTAFNGSGQPTAFIDKLVDATHTIKFFVNGSPSPDFDQYEPEDGDQMVISYETIPSATAPTLNPINNVTMASNPTAGAPTRTIQIPLDGLDPNALALTYTVTSSNSSVTAALAPSTNRYLKLNVSAKDISGNNFTGDLIFQLFDDQAPNTVGRIVQLVQTPKSIPGTGNFYDGLTFHRIVNDFVAQGGDPSGNGSGGSGVTFSDEFKSSLTFDGFGQLAMANSGDDTNDSQFFITDSNLSLVENASSPNENPPRSLTFQHTIFGQLVSGFDTFNKIMLTPVHNNPSTGEKSSPDSAVTINTASIVTDTQHAVLRLTAPAGFTGTSNITVTATNTGSQTAQRSFVATVATDTVNDRPFLGTVTNQTTRVNTPITITLPATDVELDTLTFVVRDPTNFANQPSNVTVSINQGTRQATITPATGFVGTVNLLIGVRDSTPRVDTNSDGQLNSSDNLDVRGNFDTQQIQLTVSDSNIAPTATAQSVKFRLNTAANITLTGDDGDPGVTQTLTFIIDTLPTNGTLRDSSSNAITAGATLTSPNITYTPNTGSTAADQFTFHVKDNGGTANGGQDTSAVATISLSLQANLEPTATAQTVQFTAGTPVTITLSGADGDSDVTQTLTFRIDTLPAHGTLTDSNNAAVTVGTALPSGTVTFTPAAGFKSDDSFTFHVTDNGGTANGGDDTSPTATISLRGPASQGATGVPTLKNHVLSIIGSSDDDEVTVDLNTAGDAISVVINGAAATEFPLTDVERIRIHCRGGNDDVTVSEDVEVSAHIRGGKGDDSLTGGGGNDVIRGRLGDDVVDGGSGDDSVHGGRGNDDISGSDGNDKLYGRLGDDTIDGGDGNDRAHAGPGTDQVDNVEHGGNGGANQAIAAAVRERQLSESSSAAQNSAIAAMTAERFVNNSDDSQESHNASLEPQLVDAVLAGV